MYFFFVLQYASTVPLNNTSEIKIRVKADGILKELIYQVIDCLDGRTKGYVLGWEIQMEIQ